MTTPATDPAAMEAALNSPMILGAANTIIRSFATIERISCGRDGGLSIRLLFLGETAPFTVGLRKASFSEDGSSVTLSGMSSDKPWLNGMMRLLEGRAVILPPEVAVAVPIIRPTLQALGM